MAAPEPEVLTTNGMRIGWGDKSFAVKGPLVVAVILVIMLGGIVFYFHDLQRKDHERIMRQGGIAICVSLYDFTERKILREALRQDPQATKSWCPTIN